MNELQFHPLADLFPLMEGEEFDALVDDIVANGQRLAIVLYEGMVLDGRNRYRACLKAGIEPIVQQHRDGCPGISDPVAFIISANIHRRHLTAEQKREFIAKVIAAKPEASDRQIAKQVKADHKTVGSVRAEREATGEISPVDKRVGGDGRARKQPTKRKRGKRLVATKESAAKMRAQAEAEEAPLEAEIDRLVAHLDRELAGALLGFFERVGHIHAGWHLERALGRLLPAPVENADTPEASADAMKATLAALDISEPAIA
jgi:hypothetical protein